MNIDITESEINNLQSFIDSLGLEKPMSAEQYMNIDEEIESRNINDEEIISLVNRSLFQEEDEIEEPAIYPTLNVKSALESLHQEIGPYFTARCMHISLKTCVTPVKLNKICAEPVHYTRFLCSYA